jgi:VRR-NUC domain
MVMKKTEDQEQEALFEYAALQKEIEWSLLFSIPNGGFRSKRTGARMKRTGLKAGLPDIFLPVVRGSYPGLFIEMKSEKGVVQKNQKAWHDTLRAQGYKVEVCRGCGEAVRTIRDYFER